MITRITKENIDLFNQIYKKRTSANLLINSIDDPNLYIYVVHDQEVYGWISIVFMPKVGYRDGVYFLDELYVHPDYENKGYGNDLVHFMAKTFSDKEIRLCVEEHNERAIHLYKKVGFKVLNITKYMTKEVK